MKFIDIIIQKESDNNIYWLWKHDISKFINKLNLTYSDSIITYYYKNGIEKHIIKFFNKKNKYPSIFIFVLPYLDISVYRQIIEIKDGLMLYNNKLIFFNIPYVFIISDRKSVPIMITIHKFCNYYLSDDY